MIQIEKNQPESEPLSKQFPGSLWNYITKKGGKKRIEPTDTVRLSFILCEKGGAVNIVGNRRTR